MLHRESKSCISRCVHRGSYLQSGYRCSHLQKESIHSDVMSISRAVRWKVCKRIHSVIWSFRCIFLASTTCPAPSQGNAPTSPSSIHSQTNPPIAGSTSTYIQTLENIPSQIAFHPEKQPRKSLGYRNQNSPMEHPPPLLNLHSLTHMLRGVSMVPNNLVIMDCGFAIMASLVESTIFFAKGTVIAARDLER